MGWETMYTQVREGRYRWDIETAMTDGWEQDTKINEISFSWLAILRDLKPYLLWVCDLYIHKSPFMWLIAPIITLLGYEWCGIFTHAICKSIMPWIKGVKQGFYLGWKSPVLAEWSWQSKLWDLLCIVDHKFRAIVIPLWTLIYCFFILLFIFILLNLEIQSHAPLLAHPC